ncbi:MAG: helix-turn-helix transcriptional regulator [Oscillospiraceae bacterium]|nr:helix-turn-helix transcriptional regulator [Oscillospiraceae bacterium]
MSISMEKVKALMENKGMKKWDLRQRGINGTVLDKVLSGPLNKSKRVDTETINKLCHILECQPGDIMEYVEDGDAE